MRKMTFITFSLILVLCFTIVTPVFALEGSESLIPDGKVKLPDLGKQDPLGESKNPKDEKAPIPPIKDESLPIKPTPVDPKSPDGPKPPYDSKSVKMVVNHKVGKDGMWIYAKLVGSKKYDGNWIVKNGGQTEIISANGSQPLAKHLVLDSSSSDKITIKVTFKGTTDDKPYHSTQVIIITIKKPPLPSKLSISASYKLTPHYLQVHATLNQKVDKGMWVATFQGKKMTKENIDSTFATLFARKKLVKGKHPLTITFTGKVDQQDVKLSKTLIVYIPGTVKPILKKPYVIVTGSSNKGKITLKAQLYNAKNVHGTWRIHILKKGKTYFDRSFTNQTDKRLLYTLHQALSAGTYEAVVTFHGQADYQMVSAADRIGIVVKRTANRVPVIEYPNEVTIPTQPKEIVVTGGKLPVTATNFPMQLAAGGLMIGMGLGIWLKRKRRQSAN